MSESRAYGEISHRRADRWTDRHGAEAGANWASRPRGVGCIGGTCSTLGAVDLNEEDLYMADTLRSSTWAGRSRRQAALFRTKRRYLRMLRCLYRQQRLVLQGMSPLYWKRRPDAPILANAASGLPDPAVARYQWLAGQLYIRRRGISCLSSEITGLKRSEQGVLVWPDLPPMPRPARGVREADAQSLAKALDALD